MCLIIAKPKGKVVPADWMFNSWEHNSDSLGISYYDDNGNQKIHKWVKPSREKIRKAILIVEDNQDRDVLIHFRFSTHGKTDEANCHPFSLGKYAVIAHNGVIPGCMCKKGLRSDTAIYIQDVLMPFVKEFGVTNVLEYLHEMTHKDIGSSKLCALDRNGKWYFANENYGSWKDGVWLSNTYSIGKPFYGNSDYEVGTARYVDSKWKYNYDHSIYDIVLKKMVDLPAGWTKEYRMDERGYVITTFDGTELRCNDGWWDRVINEQLIAEVKEIFKNRGSTNPDYEFALYAGLCPECGNDLVEDYCYDCGINVTQNGPIHGPPLPKVPKDTTPASTGQLALPTGVTSSSA